jgi:DNA replication and repair protein RecF
MSGPCAAATGCCPKGGADPAWLDGLEAQMSELGVAMAMARSEVVRLLVGP